MSDDDWLVLPGRTADRFFVPAGPARLVAARLTPGGRMVGMSKGQFSVLDLIAAFLEVTGPAAVTLSTWTAGIRDIGNAALLLTSGAITSLDWVVDRSFAARQPAYCAALQRRFGPESIRCTRMHAKVAMVRGGGRDVVIRSSANINRNPRFEQYDIDDSAEIADFYGLWFATLKTEMPPGVDVPCADVDEVFHAIAAGRNPFDNEVAGLRAAGVPLDSPAEFGAWMRERLAERRAEKQPAATARKLAARLKLPVRVALSAAAGELESDNPAVVTIALALMVR